MAVQGIEHLAVHHVNQERIRVITLRHDDISDRFFVAKAGQIHFILTCQVLHGTDIERCQSYGCRDQDGLRGFFGSLFEDIILFQTNVILIIGTYLIKNLIQLGGSCLWVCFCLTQQF